MSKITSLQEVLVDQLKDLYSAETQITKALPKMAKAACYAYRGRPAGGALRDRWRQDPHHNVRRRSGNGCKAFQSQ
jgi:Domain of unknown function (DUF892)